MLGLYLIMGPLELYGRVRGVYRTGCDPPVLARVNATHVGASVICFGDSLTAGYGTTSEQSFPQVLGQVLASRGVRVLNLGRSGDTTADGLHRLVSDVLESPFVPCTVVVGFGGNDLIQRWAPAETFRNLEEMVSRLQDAGCLVVLLGLRGSWLYKVDYHSPFREVAQRTGCGLIPVCLDGIWGVPWSMADAAHPNARGYRVLAQRVAAHLQEYPR